MTIRYWAFALMYVFSCGDAANCQSYCPPYFPQPPNPPSFLDTQVTNMVNYLTSVPSPFASGVTYKVHQGSIAFPGLPPTQPATTCAPNGGENNPNPSSCYGVYQIPPRNGGTTSGIYTLDPDEALLFIGLAPTKATGSPSDPHPNYYGFQTYVFQRRDDVSLCYPTTCSVPPPPPTPYASVGPAINQRNANGVNPSQPWTALRTSSTDFHPIFYEQLAIISTASSQMANYHAVTGDVQTALSHLWSTPNQTWANNLTNIEVLPVLPGSSKPNYGLCSLDLQIYLVITIKCRRSFD